MTGKIHSLQSLGTVDGPGVRAVVFAEGCPLRCAYCHNPDTWDPDGGESVSVDALSERIGRLYNYIKDGGVTFSGGEPCLQSEFFSELTDKLHNMGLHVALDTSGAILTEAARELISKVDLILLDIKFTTDGDYKKYIGMPLSRAIETLDYIEGIGKSVVIREVIIPGINDTEESARQLGKLLSGYKSVADVELLPFRKLCLPKYRSLGIPFPLENYPEGKRSVCEALRAIVLGEIHK